MAKGQSGAPSEFGTDGEGLWRPEPWRLPLALELPLSESMGRLALGPEATFCHDGTACSGQISRPDLPRDGPFPLAVALDLFRGSFVSFILEVPPAMTSALTGGHIAWLALDCGTAPAGPLHARLNLRLHARLAQQARSFEFRADGKAHAGFDLGAAGLGAVAAEQAWIDVIFSAPVPMRLHIGDLTVRFRRRAEM